MEVVMTTAEVAEMLRASEKSIRRWATEGLLPFFRVKETGHMRFRRQDIERIVAGYGDTGLSVVSEHAPPT